MTEDSYGEHHFSFSEGGGALFVMLFFPTIFAVATGWIGYALWADYSANPDRNEWWPAVVCLGFCLVFIALCVWVYKGRKRSVEVYVKGVAVTHRGKSQFYPFEQMSELTSGVFKAGGVRQRRRARYVGCEAVMADGKKVSFLRGNHMGVLDPDLQKLLITLREAYDGFSAKDG